MDRSQNSSEDLTDNVEEDRKPHRQRAQRLPAHERRAAILKEAAVFFAEQGFAASTRDLADRLGVRQALLYKYYPSKDALLEAIFDAIFSARLTADWLLGLRDRTQPLEARICAIYQSYTQKDGGIGSRLFLRASLDSDSLPNTMVSAQRDQLMALLIEEMRHDSGLPDTQARAALVGEYELALMLHGAIVFNQIRPNGHAPDHDDMQRSVLRLYVATFLEGARSQMKALHNGSASTDLSTAWN